MLRFVLSTALSLHLLFTLLSTAAIAISSTQPPNPALSGFSRCDYGGWCWFGIRPGVTTVREADQLLRDAGYDRVKQRTYILSAESGLCDIALFPYEEFEIVQSVFLTCGDQILRDGDLAGILGNPTGLGIYEPDQSYGGHIYAISPFLIFENLMLRTRTRSGSLFDGSTFFSLTSVGDIRVVEWRDFTYYDYCRLAPYEDGCS